MWPQANGKSIFNATALMVYKAFMGILKQSVLGMMHRGPNDRRLRRIRSASHMGPEAPLDCTPRLLLSASEVMIMAFSVLGSFSA